MLLLRVVVLVSPYLIYFEPSLSFISDYSPVPLLAACASAIFFPN